MARESLEQAIAHLDTLRANGAIGESAYSQEKENLIRIWSGASQENLGASKMPTPQGGLGPAAASSLDLFMTGGPGLAPQPAVKPTNSIQRPQQAPEGPIGADIFSTGGALPVSSASPEKRESVEQTPKRDGWVGYLAASRYRIVSELGRGGMGRVYQAEDTQTSQMVAIKTLEAHLLGTEWSEKWLQELQVHSRIKHPNIASMRQLEKDVQLGFFLTMDFVKGQDIERFLRSSKAAGRVIPFSTETSLQLLRDMAEALDHAHQQGVIHLDIKPANVLILGPSCEPEEFGSSSIDSFVFDSAKLIDFGIAQLRSGQTEGQVLGTVYYMAPEQLSGAGALSAATDVYALGVVAYQLLTGQIFQGGMPGPSVLNTILPEAIDEVHAKAVSYRAEDRFQRAGAFIDALVQALKQKRAATLAHEPKTSVQTKVRTVHKHSTKRVTEVPKRSQPTNAEQRWPQIKQKIDTKRPQWLDIPFVRKAPKTILVSDFAKGSFGDWPVIPLAESAILLDRNEKPLLELCSIPEGSFLMGADAKDRSARRPEKPQKKVSMSHFWMARTPITRRIWACFLKESHYQPATKHPSYLPAWNPNSFDDEHHEWNSQRHEHPISSISMIDAWAFCDFYGLALPSEAQWEYGFRGTDGRSFPWGETIPKPKNPETMLGQIGQIYQDTVPVGMRLHAASPFGLLDGIGPVLQWTADEYDARWLRQVRGSDPILLGKRREGFYSVRGAAAMTPADQAQVYRRASVSPDVCRNDLGFRPCLDL